MKKYLVDVDIAFYGTWPVRAKSMVEAKKKCEKIFNSFKPFEGKPPLWQFEMNPHVTIGRAKIISNK